MRPDRLIRVAALGALAAAVAWAPSGADAADAVDGGWWWRLQSGQLVAVPPPPGVPEGGLLVQGSVDGASAVAAVRYQLADHETAPVLRLRFAEGGNESAATAIVLACPATTSWRSGGAQPWAEKPVPDCTRQAIGELADDGASMTFDLSSFIADPVVDVVLLPGVVDGLPEGLNGSSFTMVFERPADADLVTQPAGAPIAAPPVAPSSGSTVAAAAPSGGRPAPTPSFRPPAAPVAPALPPSEVASPGATRRGATPEVAVAPFQPASVDAGGAKALAVVLLVGAMAAMALAGRRDVVLRLLGAAPVTGAPAAAGLGRFARARDGAPPSLR